MLNLLAYNYENNPEVEGFIVELKKVIPCEECQGHFNEYLEETVYKSYGSGDKYFNSKDQMIAWVLSLHNKVNGRSGVEPWTRERYISYLDKKFTSPQAGRIPREDRKDGDGRFQDMTVNDILDQHNTLFYKGNMYYVEGETLYSTSKWQE